MSETKTHAISVVVPVYRGATTLPGVVAELLPYGRPFRTPGGRTAVVEEVILVHDNGPDDSDEVIRRLAAEHDLLRPVWLSRNFGQHAATLAGIAASGGEWIATLDEDGQHDPVHLPQMLDVALDQRAQLVYGTPASEPPHGVLRNTLSRSAKRVVDTLTGQGTARHFSSYRLVLGEYARSISAYASTGVFLDVALSWVVGRVATSPIEPRNWSDRPSGYSLRSLLSHFWRMVLTGGTRLLRVVSLAGAVLGVLGLVLAAYVLGIRIFGETDVQGWASVMVAILLCTGAILFALGVIAEYLGLAVNMALGKPPYVMVQDPGDGPLGAARRAPAAAEPAAAEPSPVAE